MPSHAAAGSLVLVAALCGCAADRVVGVPSASHARVAPTPTSQACPFQIESVEDQREAEDLGSMGRTLVGGENFRSWFRDGMAATPGHSTQPTPVKVHITLARAYIQGISTMKAANIIVKVRVTNARGTSAPRMYRGVDASVNWANSQSEVQAAFDGALEDLRRQLAADLSAACTG